MFVKYIDHMGNDQRVVDIARQSFAKSDAAVRTEAQNQGLLRYLAEGISSKQRNEIILSILKGVGNEFYFDTEEDAEKALKNCIEIYVTKQCIGLHLLILQLPYKCRLQFQFVLRLLNINKA